MENPGLKGLGAALVEAPLKRIGLPTLSVLAFAVGLALYERRSCDAERPRIVA
jgi:hypothetical protein